MCSLMFTRISQKIQQVNTYFCFGLSLLIKPASVNKTFLIQPMVIVGLEWSLPVTLTLVQNLAIHSLDNANIFKGFAFYFTTGRYAVIYRNQWTLSSEVHVHVCPCLKTIWLHGSSNTELFLLYCYLVSSTYLIFD